MTYNNHTLSLLQALGRLTASYIIAVICATLLWLLAAITCSAVHAGLSDTLSGTHYLAKPTFDEISYEILILPAYNFGALLPSIPVTSFILLIAFLALKEKGLLSSTKMRHLFIFGLSAIMTLAILLYISILSGLAWKDGLLWQHAFSWNDTWQRIWIYHAPQNYSFAVIYSYCILYFNDKFLNFAIPIKR